MPLTALSVSAGYLPGFQLSRWQSGSVGTTLKPFDALWCAPGSPYKSMDGALRAIQFAREQGWPFIGT